MWTDSPQTTEDNICELCWQTCRNFLKFSVILWCTFRGFHLIIYNYKIIQLNFIIRGGPLKLLHLLRDMEAFEGIHSVQISSSPPSANTSSPSYEVLKAGRSGIAVYSSAVFFGTPGVLGKSAARTSTKKTEEDDCAVGRWVSSPEAPGKRDYIFLLICKKHAFVCFRPFFNDYKLSTIRWIICIDHPRVPSSSHRCTVGKDRPSTPLRGMSWRTYCVNSWTENEEQDVGI